MAVSTVKEKTLSNGLKIIGEITPANKSCAIGFFVKTGARDEQKVESGVSHFLEHMLFKGTEKRSTFDITFEMGAIGAQSNAYTSEENTVYYGMVLPEYVSAFQDILSDMMRPALDQSEFDMEKKVILEEIALYLDRPHFYLFENAATDFYGLHPAGNSILGTSESVSGISRDAMKAYFDRRYSPSNICLVGAGNFDWDKFVSDAESLCGNWPEYEVDRSKPEFNYRAISKTYYKENIQQCHLLLAAPGVSATHPARYAMMLIAMMLGDSSGSKLYWELVETGIVEDAHADSEERDGVGIFTVYASFEPEKLDKVRSVIERCIEDLKNFTDDELERAKTKVCTRIVMQGEMPMGRLMALGSNWNNRSEIHSLSAEIDNIKATGRKDIENALEQFPFNPASEFLLMPAG